MYTGFSFKLDFIFCDFYELGLGVELLSKGLVPDHYIQIAGVDSITKVDVCVNPATAFDYD